MTSTKQNRQNKITRLTREERIDRYFAETLERDLHRTIAAEGVLGAARMVVTDDILGDNEYGCGRDFTIDEVVESWTRTGRLVPQKIANDARLAAVSILTDFIASKVEELEDELVDCGAGTGLFEAEQRGFEVVLDDIELSPEERSELLGQARCLTDLVDEASMRLEIRTEAFEKLLERANDVTLDVETLVERLQSC